MCRLATGLMIVAAALALAACKIVPTAEVEAARQGGSAGGAVAFDPDRMVNEMWDAKVIPYLKAKAGDFATVRDLAAKNPDEAGTRFGFRAKEGSTPWTYVIKAQGRIVAANTQSRAATIDVDVDQDGKADMVVQIGPALRGTTLRDSLDFVSFNSFTNQIDYAQFGKAFNTYVDDKVLKEVPRDALVGKTATVEGAFPLPSGQDFPLITPLTLEIKP